MMTSRLVPLVLGLVVMTVLSFATPASAACMSKSTLSCSNIINVQIFRMYGLPGWSVIASIKSPHTMGCYTQSCPNNPAESSVDEIYFLGYETTSNMPFVEGPFLSGCPSQGWNLYPYFSQYISSFAIKIKFQENGGTRKKKNCTIFLPPLDSIPQAIVSEGPDYLLDTD